MEIDNSFHQGLNRFTDTLIVGLLIAALSLPVVTAFAALRAGVAVLAERNSSGSLAGRFAVALRSDLRGSLALGVVFASSAVVGAGDVLVAMSGNLGPATVPVQAVGLALLLAAAVLPPWVAALARLDAGAGFRALTRHAALAAVARPALSARLVAVVVAGTALSVAVPVLAPVALGVLASVASRLPALALKPSHIH